MGGNNNQGQSGNDPRGRVQNQVAHQRERYENQQGPMVSNFAYNYGRGSEANYGDYTDIMNNYRQIASGGGGGDDGGGGGGGGGGGDVPTFTPFLVSPGRASYSDPFESYAGMKEFSQTGGYSPEDLSNMRARGISPIRAAYANAEREIGRQRSLQGGYSPNAIASMVKMARERGQASADAAQNVEAQLAQMKNEGRRFGLTGMGNIEGQRLGADVDLSKFNVGLDFQGQQFNANAQEQAQARNAAAAASARAAGSAAAAQSVQDRLRALSGMTALYGTTPGMANTFGNQVLQGVGQGGNFGLGLINAEAGGQQLPGAYDQTMGRIKDIYNTGATMAYPWLTDERQPTTQGTGNRRSPVYAPGPGDYGDY